MKSARKNTHLSSLDFEMCSIELSAAEGWQDVIDAVSSNCTLFEVNLHDN